MRLKSFAASPRATPRRARDDHDRKLGFLALLHGVRCLSRMLGPLEEIRCTRCNTQIVFAEAVPIPFDPDDRQIKGWDDPPGEIDVNDDLPVLELVCYRCAEKAK